MTVHTLTSTFNATPSQQEVDAFVEAVSKGNQADIADFMNTYPSAFDKANSCGQNALLLAAIRGNTGLATLLLEKGADINKKDNSKWTPLMAASWNGHTDTVKLLLEKGADVHEKDQKDQTALMCAAWCGYPAIAELLLKAGTRLGDKDHKGKTALILAHLDPRFRLRREHLEVIALLEQWPEMRKRLAAEKKAQFLKDTDFSQGLDHTIRAPRPFKVPSRPGR